MWRGSADAAGLSRVFSEKEESWTRQCSASGKLILVHSVQYQAKPKGEQRCDNCINFIAESKTCKLVDGQISPEGWCSLWAKKA